ncbi:hypothetical protein ACOMHN_021547 [Nucella lapillus]
MSTSGELTVSLGVEIAVGLSRGTSSLRRSSKRRASGFAGIKTLPSRMRQSRPAIVVNNKPEVPPHCLRMVTVELGAE